MGAGEDWNETFQGLFDANKGPVLSPTPPGADEGAEGAAETPTEASNDAPAEAPVEAPVEAVTEGPQEGVAFAVWKTLLPQLFETAEERVRLTFLRHCAIVSLCHCVVMSLHPMSCVVLSRCPVCNLAK